MEDSEVLITLKFKCPYCQETLHHNETNILITNKNCTNCARTVKLLWSAKAYKEYASERKY